MPPKSKPKMEAKAPKKKLILKPPQSDRLSVPEFMPRSFKNVLADRRKYQQQTADKWEEEIKRLKQNLKTGGLGGKPATDGARYNINKGIKEATQQLKYIKSTKYLELLKKRKKEDDFKPPKEDLLSKVKKEEANVEKDIRNPNHGYIGLSDSQVVVKKQKFRNTTKAKMATLFKKVVGRPINVKGKTVKSLSISAIVGLLLKNKVPEKDIEPIYKKYRAEMES